MVVSLECHICKLFGLLNYILAIKKLFLYIGLSRARLSRGEFQTVIQPIRRRF